MKRKNFLKKLVIYTTATVVTFVSSYSTIQIQAGIFDKFFEAFRTEEKDKVIYEPEKPKESLYTEIKVSKLLRNPKKYDGEKLKITYSVTEMGLGLLAIHTDSGYYNIEYEDCLAYIAKDKDYGNIVSGDWCNIYATFDADKKELDADYIEVLMDKHEVVSSDLDSVVSAFLPDTTPKATTTPAHKTEDSEPRRESDAGMNPPQKEADYVLSESNARYLTNDDIDGMDNDKLQLAINEIYARRGRKFSMDLYKEYFNTKSWYNGTIEPENFSDSVFNEYEKANIDFLSNAMNNVSTSSTAATNSEEPIWFAGMYITTNDVNKMCSLDVSVYTSDSLSYYSVGDTVGNCTLITAIPYDNDAMTDYTETYGNLIKQGLNVYTIENTGITLTVADNSIAVSGYGVHGDGIYQLSERYRP